MFHSSIPQPIAQRILMPLKAVQVDAVPSGMSGAMVFRCRLASGEARALRCWPEGTTLARVLEVSRVAIHARDNGCDLVPRVFSCSGQPAANHDSVIDGGACVDQHQGRYWQLLEWMPGEPLGPDCDLPSIERGGAAICRFHASVAGLHTAAPHTAGLHTAGPHTAGLHTAGPHTAGLHTAGLHTAGLHTAGLAPGELTTAGTRGGCFEKSAPAIRDRLDRVQWLTPRLNPILDGFRAGADGLPTILVDALHQSVQMLRWKWNEVAVRITRSLSKDAERIWRGQYVIRDVHRENALFVAGDPSGIIDLDAVRIDTPWIDLARWAGSFFGKSHQSRSVWDAAMAGFCSQHSLNNSPEMEFGPELAANLCFATTWIAIANWLVWIVGERRQFDASPERISARIKELHLVAVQGI